MIFSVSLGAKQLAPYNIAIAAYGKYAKYGTYWDDDAWLKFELEQRGHHVDIIDWHDEQVKLTEYQGIFVSSTWDIPSNPSAFEHWLDLCEADHVKRLINASQLLRRGIRKYDYLNELIEWFSETAILAHYGCSDNRITRPSMRHWH
jgi:hypothetical protein